MLEGVTEEGRGFCAYLDDEGRRCSVTEWAHRMLPEQGHAYVPPVPDAILVGTVQRVRDEWARAARELRTASHATPESQAYAEGARDVLQLLLSEAGHQ
jgi:hypothetical protein